MQATGCAGKGLRALTEACRGLARAEGVGVGFRHFFWPSPAKLPAMLTVILFLAGLVCFWVFFKSIDYFEKI
jgi:hypothetical protein